jgi:hypothetical protein
MPSVRDIRRHPFRTALRVVVELLGVLLILYVLAQLWQGLDI